MMLNLIQKINPYLLLISLLLFAGGCIKPDPWQNLTIKTGSQTYNFSKLTHIYNQENPLQLEILALDHDLIAYINIDQGKLPCYEKDEGVALVCIRAKHKNFSFLADRLSGGQKIKIPNDILDDFLAALKENSEVIISIDQQYKTKILSHKLSDKIKKLMKERESHSIKGKITLSL